MKDEKEEIERAMKDDIVERILTYGQTCYERGLSQGEASCKADFMHEHLDYSNLKEKIAELEARNAKLTVADAPCEVCWTYSWGPVEKPIEGVPNRRLGDNDWMVCQLCLAGETIKKLESRKD